MVPMARSSSWLTHLPSLPSGFILAPEVLSRSSLIIRAIVVRQNTPCVTLSANNDASLTAGISHGSYAWVAALRTRHWSYSPCHSRTATSPSGLASRSPRKPGTLCNATAGNGGFASRFACNAKTSRQATTLLFAPNEVRHPTGQPLKDRSHTWPIKRPIKRPSGRPIKRPSGQVKSNRNDRLSGQLNAIIKRRSCEARSQSSPSPPQPRGTVQLRSNPGRSADSKLPDWPSLFRPDSNGLPASR